MQKYNVGGDLENGICINDLDIFGDDEDDDDDDEVDDNDDDDSGNSAVVVHDYEKKDPFTDDERNKLLNNLRTVAQRRIEQWTSEIIEQSKKVENKADGTMISKEKSIIQRKTGSIMQDHVMSSITPLRASFVPSTAIVVPQMQTSFIENNNENCANNFQDEILEITTTVTTTTSTIKRVNRFNQLFYSDSKRSTSCFANSLNGTPAKSNDLDLSKPKRTSKRRLSYSDHVQQSSKQPRLEIAIYNPNQQKRNIHQKYNQEMVMTANSLKRVLNLNSVESSDADYSFRYNRANQLTYQAGKDKETLSNSVEKAKKGKLDAFTACRAIDPCLIIKRT